MVWEHPVDDTSGGEYDNRKLTLYSEINWLGVLADSLQQQPNQDCFFREPEILKFRARVAECEGGNVGWYYLLLGDLERKSWAWAGVPVRRSACLILQLEDGVCTTPARVLPFSTIDAGLGCSGNGKRCGLYEVLRKKK